LTHPALRATLSFAGAKGGSPTEIICPLFCANTIQKGNSPLFDLGKDQRGVARSAGVSPGSPLKNSPPKQRNRTFDKFFLTVNK